jgi:hypothetical protein
MFGASISFKRGDSTFETVTVDGKELKREFATITDLYATDLVDDPAATDGLFEAFQHEDLASQVTLFLDSHPELFSLIDKQPDLITEFIIKYQNYKAHSQSELPSILREGSGGGSHTKTFNLMNISEEFTNLKSWLKENFTLKSKPDDFELQVNQKLSEFEKLIAPQSDFHKEKEGLDSKISDLTVQNKTLSDKILSLESKINQLEAAGTSLESEGDPSLNISKPVDQAGKELLQAIPEDQKRQFRTHSNKVSKSKSE